MRVRSLSDVAVLLPDYWRSAIIGSVAGANIKLIKMAGEGIPDEVHDQFDEFLLVVEGQMELIVAGAVIYLVAGEYCQIPRGVIHSVRPGSEGLLLLVDTGDPAGLGQETI